MPKRSIQSIEKEIDRLQREVCKRLKEENEISDNNSNDCGIETPQPVHFQIPESPESQPPQLMATPRRRIISVSSSSSSSSSSSNDSQNDVESVDNDYDPTRNEANQDEDKPQEESKLNEDILKLLGDSPDHGKQCGPNIHEDVAKRWRHIAKFGLELNIKNLLIEKYPPPDNFPELVPPKLNTEIVTSLFPGVSQHDAVLEFNQRLLDSTISAVGQALNKLLKRKNEDEELIRNVSDAGRILCSLHNNHSKMRRHLIKLHYTNRMKEILQNTEINEYLFGDNLSEKILVADTLRNHTVPNNAPKCTLLPTPRQVQPRNAGQQQTQNRVADAGVPPKFGKKTVRNRNFRSAQMNREFLIMDHYNISTNDNGDMPSLTDA